MPTDALRVLTQRVLAVLALAMLAAPAWAAPWTTLTPAQQEALAPLQKEWDAMPDKQQHYYLKLANRYPGLSAEKKKRLHDQLEYWSRLTPEQRERIRMEYRAYKRKQHDKGKAQSPASAPSAAASAPAAAPRN